MKVLRWKLLHTTPNLSGELGKRDVCAWGRNEGLQIYTDQSHTCILGYVNINIHSALPSRVCVLLFNRTIKLIC